MKTLAFYAFLLQLLTIINFVSNIMGYTPITEPIKQKNFIRVLISTESIGLSNVRVGNPTIIYTRLK